MSEAGAGFSTRIVSQPIVSSEAGLLLAAWFGVLTAAGFSAACFAFAWHPKRLEMLQKTTEAVTEETIAALFLGGKGTHLMATSTSAERDVRLVRVR